MSMGFVKSAYSKENFGGNKMFKKLKDKKGFTLVELIVVLVILAILAALLIPALTGYIDKANAEKVVSETRMVVMAAQTEASTCYSKGALTEAKTGGTEANKPTTTAIDKLAEIKAGGKYEIELDSSGKVLAAKYSNDSFVCVYVSGGYTVNKATADNKVSTSKVTVLTTSTPTIAALANSIV